MIQKLYDLKKMQTDQKLIERGQVLNEINHINAEIIFTQNKINTTSVDKIGAISDFALLEIHKNTMRVHIENLSKEKERLNKQLAIFTEQIIELQKESEQFKYILEEEKQEKIRLLLKEEEEASSEYVQSKYIAG